MKRERNENLEKALDILLENEKDPSKIFSKDGLYKTLTKRLAEKLLESEMQEHLGYEKYNQNQLKNNYRNGNSTKRIITENGTVELEIPRDRNGNFEPTIVPKHQRRIDGFDQKVLTLYAKGMSLSDIKIQLEELYGAEVSTNLISKITDDVLEDVKIWQNRPLDAVYPIVYFDCIVVKVRQDKRIINKAIYIALGLECSGVKDILGLWISENEGAKFWLNNLVELKNRGLQDILIACTDNLPGMSEAIKTVFPKTEHQLCIVHQIRTSLKYVSYKDRKNLVKDLKPIYTAINEQEASLALESFGEKWAKKYPYISKTWKQNWVNLILFLEYPAEIRKVIYTTNPIESVNSQLRKVIKNKRVFPNDNSVWKIFYLAIEYMKKKWTMAPHNWSNAMSHFMIKFEGRLPI
jgi:putative transposase